MNESHIERLILQYVARPKYQPVKARILARNLDVPKEDHDAFKQLVKRLVRDGKLDYAERHKVKRASSSSAATRSEASSANEVIGKSQRKSGGFGFVRPNDAKPGPRERDVFVRGHQAMDATSGDTVRVLSLIHI